MILLNSFYPFQPISPNYQDFECNLCLLTSLNQRVTEYFVNCFVEDIQHSHNLLWKLPYGEKMKKIYLFKKNPISNYHNALKEATDQPLYLLPSYWCQTHWAVAQGIFLSSLLSSSTHLELHLFTRITGQSTNSFSTLWCNSSSPKD